MSLTAQDIAWIRDEVGETPDDATLNSYYDELTDRTLVAIRVLKRRRATLVAGDGIDSFTLSGVFSVSKKASVKDLDTQIARLEALYEQDTGEDIPGGATVGRVYRTDRGGLIAGGR